MTVTGSLAFAIIAVAAIAYAFTSLPTAACTVTPATSGSTATYVLSQGRTGNTETMHRSDLTFPAGTDLTGVTGANVSGDWTGGSTGNTVVRVGQTLQITWGTACPTKTNFAITVGGVVNPGAGAYNISGLLYSNTVPGGAAFTSAQYTITAAASLSVAQGADAGRPTTRFYGARSADSAVDELVLTASNGPMTVTQIVVRGLDTVGTLQTDVSGVKLYRDDGTTPGHWDAGDSQLDATQAFSGQASGSTATFSALALAIASGTTEKVWIVYTPGASAVDGHLVGSRVNVGDVSATGGAVTQAADIVSANAGQTMQIDAAAPVADTSDPLDNAILTGGSKTVSGTSSDGTGSGVAQVQVQIARSSGGYWNGTDWTGTAATWLPTVGTTNWTYTWTLDAGQNNGLDTYSVTARATDGVGLIGSDATPVTGVKVDNITPAILSAAAADGTHVDVVFSEPLQGGSIQGTDFTIAGLTVSGAVLDADGYTVHLTTSAQSNVTYTVQCGAGTVLDSAGNTNGATGSTFAGFASPTLTVSQGADAGRPTALGYSARATDKVADELALSAAGGTMTLTGVVIRGLDTVAALLTDTSGVRLYRDNGATPGQWDGSDTQLGDQAAFAGDASGSSATISGLSLAIPSGTTEKLWVVYTVGASAVHGHVLGSRVGVGDVTASGGTVVQAADIVSANTGQTWSIDAAAPTVDTTDPLDSDVLTGTFKQLSGTASDQGSGVTSVELLIGCSDGTYWNGGAWAPGISWRPASGTTNWTYLLPLPSGENRGKTYTITARATDGVALTGQDATPPTVRVDTAGPAIVSASAVDSTHVDVVFGEALAGGSIASTDFTVATLSVTGAVLQNATTVRLTTSAQTPSASYTVVCGAGGVTDAYGVANAATQADFTGFLSYGSLAVTQGTDPGRPAIQTYAGRSEERVVDEVVLGASGGNVIVESITVRGLHTLDALTTDVSAVRLFADDGDGQYDAGDAQLGSSQTFSGDPSGSVATFASLAHTVSSGTSEKVWVVYTIGAGAADGGILGSRVQDGDIVAAGGTIGAFAPVVSAAAGQTLLVDAVDPVADTTMPASDQVLAGSAYTISGTTSDSGSGVNSVAVRIESSEGTYWNGTGFVPAETWLPATGTDSWTYDWTLPSPEDRTSTYAITARATDSVGRTGMDATPRTGVRVDNVGPQMVSAAAVSANSVDVVFGESLAPGSVQPGDFSIAGLSVLSAVLQPDNVTVRLGTTDQTPDTFYMVSVGFGAITDAYANPCGASAEGFNAFGSSSDSEAPTVPAGVTVTPGAASPLIASLAWTASADNVGVTGYRIWRALSLSGTFVGIGTSTTTSFDDETGLTGQSYYYKVSAYDAAGNESAPCAPVGPTHAAWTIAPHASYGSARLCEACHATHSAATQDKIFRDTGVAAGELAICYACHDGQGASTNVKAGATNSFALASGHRLEQAGATGDLTDTCSGCHTPHMDYTTREMLSGKDVNGTNVTAADNTWCLACHNDADSWYVGSYPPASAPSRDATGYPIVGTFPGASVYTSPTVNAHVDIPASAAFGREAGDCLYCHDSHRGPNGYDGLTRTFRPSTAATLADDQANGTYAQSCFYCHGGVTPPELSSAPTDIKQFATAGGTRSGHRIKTAGGTLPVGAPLPCYDCHNPHGSERGNGSLLSDALGEGLNTTDAANVRSVCFSCHSSSDGQVWEDGAYVAVGTGEIEGLRRDGSDGSVLKLPSVNGHESASANSCFTCHGGSYAPGANNVHNPSGGVSQGGESCYNCHSAYTAMEDGTAPIVGANRTDFYHHVLGGSYNGGAYRDGDYAPGPSGTYPTSGVDNIFCVTCHVDHDEFNADNGGNLREQFPSYDGVGRDTDYDVTYALGGLCTSCHGMALPKDTSNQASEITSAGADPAVTTPPINPGKYAASAHTYKVESTFADSSAFRADCSKCHTDEQSKEFQTSSAKFGTHFSGARRLVSAFGGSISDPLAEDHCYGCHAPAGTGEKTVAGRDAYGATGAPMTSAAESVYTQFALAGSTHPVEADAGGSVECESCHNPHNVTTSGRVSDPDNTLDLQPYGTDSEQAAFCLRCHDGSAPAYANAAGQYVPYDVTLANPSDDKSANAARGHWSASGSISAAETEACGSCHDNHGSGAPKLLGGYDSGTGTSRIRTSEITANDNGVCAACHATPSTSYPAGEAQRDVEGYPGDGRWPGSGTYAVGYVAGTHTGNGHLNAIWPSSGYAAGDCKNCHDVHGTANTYDELRGTYDPTNAGNAFGTCFTCHDGTVGAGKASTNIKQYYPASAGGTSVEARSGHRVVTSIAGATLALGEAVPCYDCHNPHGSGSPYALQVRDIGDSAGEISLADADGVRKFCFACHSTSDTTEGWTGSGWAGVGTTVVEGIRRDGTGGNVLKLASVTGHRSTDVQSCYQCHGDNAANNVHSPSGGVSEGGQDCYGCHASYQSAMEDGLGAKTGATRAGSYHHVMGSASNDGDKAFAAGSYPNSATDVYCLSCHVDHDKFNAAKASNLRPDVTTLNPAGAATDYSSASNTGVCTSCHASSLTKQNPGTDQKDDGSTSTPKIVPGAGVGQFGASAHDYAATSDYDTAVFSANCAKCHNDEQSKDFQTSADAFGTHWSASRRLLSALGGSVIDPLAEQHCYRCHSETGDAVGGTAKPVAGRDWYDAAPMTAVPGTEKVFKQFQLASKHPVVATGGNSVECENCHNAHVVTTTARVSDPANTYNTLAYGTSGEKTTYCLKCHSGNATLPSYAVNATTYVPSTVTIAAADQAKANKSTNAGKAHWSVVGSITTPQPCGNCHDNHGSAYPSILGAYDSATGTNRVNGSAITGNNNTVCAACHTASTGTTYTRLANGYPNVGTWPGTAVYNGANGIHKTALQPAPYTYAAGDCKNCHDVHGTQYAYDETIGQFDPTSAANDKYALCLDCHDGSPSATNIDQYYPVGSGGAGTGANAGHQIKTSGGTLSQGTGLPCYDCHNPHGSAETDGLLVMSMNNGVTTAIGDAATEIDMATPAGNRLFCFTCHTTGDATPQGTNTAGTGYVNITGTATVEGLSRIAAVGANKLRLSGNAAHLAGATTQSCYTCHGNGYADAASTNVHNPGSGGSTGGTDCYSAGCHSVLQAFMEDGVGTKTGASRATVHHHVLGSATNNGDKAFAAGSYPMTLDDVFCLSCHVDHTFTAGSSLRTSISDPAKTARNQDFIRDAGGSPSYGICVGCHSSARTKMNVGTDQASGGSAQTPAIDGAAYDASKHDYEVELSGSTFKGNCTKCHTDGSTTRLTIHYSAEDRLAAALGAAKPAGSTSTEENLCYECHSGGLTAGTDGYGINPNGTPMSATSRGIALEFAKTNRHKVETYKGLHKADEYNAAPASVAPGTATGWWGAGNANKHVECEDCHNPHEAQAKRPAPSATSVRPNATLAGATGVTISGANKGTWGVNVNGATDGLWNPAGAAGTPVAPTYDKTSPAAYEWQLCLKCHSVYAFGTSPPNVSVNLGNQTPGGPQTDVGKDFSPTNYAYHPLFKAGRNQPATGLNALWNSSTGRRLISGTNTGWGLANTMTDGWLATSLVACSDCHGSEDPSGPSGAHGSTRKWMLKSADPNIKVTIANGTVTTPNNGTITAAEAGNFCLNCHRRDVYGDGTAQGPTYQGFSRMSHNGDWNGSCAGVSYTSAAISGCMNCHGGRKDDSSFNNPASTTVQSGAVHGTSITGQVTDTLEPAGPVYTATPLGYRFANGASWHTHQYDFQSNEALGCQTTATDNYSNCNKHNTGTTKNNPANYSYGP